MRRLHFALLCSTMMIGAGAFPVAPALVASPALAQQQRVEIRADFRSALEPYGRFERHERFGEVWRPGRLARDWRPYTVGRWVYTEDWGWYWNAADAEANWGWVTYHYGRWYNDPRLGWVWIAGDEWAPAWVNWRRGQRQNARYVGWSPLPPDEVVVEVRDDPDAWIFVRAQDMIAPRIASVVVRTRERTELIRETVIVNRTVVVRERGPVVVVNPGIEPAFVAAVIGRPIRAYDVRPRVFAGTANVAGAIEVRAEDLRDRRRFEQQRVQVRQTQTTIRPAQQITEPKPLEANEQGRLGDRPPRAAESARDPRRRDAQQPRPTPRPGEAAPPARDTARDPQQRDPADRQGRGTQPAPDDKPTGTTTQRPAGAAGAGAPGRDATQKPPGAERSTLPPGERGPASDRGREQQQRSEERRELRQEQREQRPQPQQQQRQERGQERGQEQRRPQQEPRGERAPQRPDARTEQPAAPRGEAQQPRRQEQQQQQQQQQQRTQKPEPGQKPDEPRRREELR